MSNFRRNINRKFTYWYIKRGYTFEYINYYEPVWHCPWWVKPLLIFFSPSIYMYRKCGEIFCENFRRSLKEATVSLNEATKTLNDLAKRLKEDRENKEE